MCLDHFRTLIIRVIHNRHAQQIHTFVLAVYVLGLLILVAPQTTAIRAQHQVQIRT
jgi:hypothetical protein